jgi:hypothetical protein
MYDYMKIVLHGLSFGFLSEMNQFAVDLFFILSR